MRPAAWEAKTKTDNQTDLDRRLFQVGKEKENRHKHKLEITHIHTVELISVACKGCLINKVQQQLLSQTSNNN